MQSIEACWEELHLTFSRHTSGISRGSSTGLFVRQAIGTIVFLTDARTAMSSLAAAVQGMDETVNNGAQAFYLVVSRPGCFDDTC